MSPRVPIRGIIFDLGDVLFTWSPNTDTNISAGTLREILSSPTWFEYECGRLEQDACYTQIAREFCIEASQIAEAFSQARASLQPNDVAVNFIRDLRKSAHVNVYAMSNVSVEDFAALSEKMDWSLFDQVFTSGAVSMRKPDPNFFRHVLDRVELAPEQLVFVDDKQENVLAANRLGIKGIVFDDSTIHTLETMLDDPIARGYEYLYRNVRQFHSITDSGVVVKDNFSQLLILEATQDKSLISVGWTSKETWNFFEGEATLIPGGYFSDDLDTTSLALTVLPPDEPSVITSLLDLMAAYINPDGSIQTYFDRQKPRIDPVVTANVLGAFYRFGRGHQLIHTLQHIYEVLLHRTYIHGTRYYCSADCCLWFFTRLLRSADEKSPLQAVLGALLRKRVQERIGKDGDALDLAMRVLACDALGVECEVERAALLSLQCEDGGWDGGWLYKYGSTGVRIGNRGVATALALKAISSIGTGFAAAATANGHA